MQHGFKIIGMSDPKSFTCEDNAGSCFWAENGLPEGEYEKLFDKAKNSDNFWKQTVRGLIEFDSFGVNGSAIKGKVISVTIIK